MSRYSDKIAIAGFGREGRALLEYFRKQDKDVEVHVFDEEEVSADSPDVEVHRGLAIPDAFTVVYKSPGIPTYKLVIDTAKTQISSLTNVFLEKTTGKVIGITGTKGKSTVASLIHHILKGDDKDAHLVGNIGITPLELLEGDHKERLYVYEMSSFQCEYLVKSPEVAVLTNIFPEHLNHHGSFKAYREAKLNIARFQDVNDVFINASGIKTSFKGREIIPNFSIPFEAELLGAHNQHNCLLASAAAEVVGVPESKAREYIKTFKALPHRLEYVGKYNGISFYNDSLATIPEATTASLEALPDVDTVILGGFDRGISYEDFAKYLATTKVKTFIVFPDTGEKMIMQVGNRNIVRVSSMEEAVRSVYKYAKQCVLLSPASSSFNMFRDYKDRGEKFVLWVRNLGEGL